MLQQIPSHIELKNELVYNNVCSYSTVVSVISAWKLKHRPMANPLAQLVHMSVLRLHALLCISSHTNAMFSIISALHVSDIL